jgi:hypothetical protein
MVHLHKLLRFIEHRRFSFFLEKSSQKRLQQQINANNDVKEEKTVKNQPKMKEIR